MANLKKLNNKKLLMILVAVLVVVGGIGASGYYYNKYNNSQKEVKRLSDPLEVAKAQFSDAIAKVGKLVDLPSGETPTLKTVTDPTKLTNQPFFANTKSGDQLLIYAGAKKAILYRPSTNKIIEIAPISIGNDSTGTQSGQ